LAWHQAALEWRGERIRCRLVVFLFTRLYHWWWDWMPKYLFFAAIGALGIALVLIFKRLRNQMAQRGVVA